MKSLAAQALTFQYKLQLDNARNTINKNNVSLGDVDKALFDMSTATLKDIGEKNVEPQVEKNKTKNINK